MNGGEDLTNNELIERLLKAAQRVAEHSDRQPRDGGGDHGGDGDKGDAC